MNKIAFRLGVSDGQVARGKLRRWFYTNIGFLWGFCKG